MGNGEFSYNKCCVQFMRIPYYIFFLILLLCLTSCDPYDNRLMIINKSSERIYYSYEFGKINNYIPVHTPQNKVFYYNTETNKNVMLPDSIMNSKKYYEFVSNHCQSCQYYLEPNDTARLGLTNMEWPNEVQKAGGLTIIIFNADTLELNDWSEIVRQEKISKRYLLSITELNDLNWTVNYK